MRRSLQAGGQTSCTAAGTFPDADIHLASNTKPTTAPYAASQASSNESDQQPVDLHSQSTNDNRHLSLLFKRAQQKVNQLWSSDTDIHNRHTDPDDRELLSTLKQPAQLLQTSEHRSRNSSASDSVDLQDVLREAKELGFEAAVSSTPVADQQMSSATQDMPWTDASSNTHSHAMHNTTLHQPASSHHSINAEMTENQMLLNDTVSLGAATDRASSNDSFALGQDQDELSDTQLQLPDGNAISFAIGALDTDSLSDENINALVAQSYTEDSDPAVCLCTCSCTSCPCTSASRLSSMPEFFGADCCQSILSPARIECKCLSDTRSLC